MSLFYKGIDTIIGAPSMTNIHNHLPKGLTSQYHHTGDIDGPLHEFQRDTNI